MARLHSVQITLHKFSVSQVVWSAASQSLFSLCQPRGVWLGFTVCQSHCMLTSAPVTLYAELCASYIVC